MKIIQTINSLIKTWFRSIVAFAGMITFLFFSLQHSYLLFHIFVELFSVVIAFSLFTITWNARHNLENQYLILIGISAFFIGLLDTFHIITYEGMTIFPEGKYYANQFWIATRFLESTTMLTGFLVLKRKWALKPELSLAIFGAISTLIILSILQWHIFPVCYVSGLGQTDFKIYSEYVIILIFFITLALLRKNRKYFDISVYNLLLVSIIFAIITEFCFTLYISNFGLSNQIGHFSKLITFFLIYKANVETGFTKPTQLLFRELKISEEKLTKAIKAKSNFLAMMSHEIRTPLNGIIGMAQLLKTTKLDFEQIDYTQAIDSSSKILLSLINDILDHAKIEAGKIEIESKGFLLHQAIHDIAQLQSTQISKKGLKLEVKIDSDIPKSVIGDELRFKQIILNVLGNAIKFTDKGSIKIEANLISKENQVIALQLAIHDSGIGMGPEFLGKLFTPFSQEDASVTRRYGGTGLGLAISHRLVELMGGSIQVKSQLGQGSSFYIKVLFKEDLGQTEQLLNETLILQSNNYKNLPKLRILVAEDQPINRMLINKILQKAGHDVTLVENGQEAINEYLNRQYDLILMDILMPILDGATATSSIREKEKNRANHTPIIALSAFAFNEEKNRYLNYGFDGYVTKPIEIPKLFSEISKSLKSKNFL